MKLAPTIRKHRFFTEIAAIAATAVVAIALIFELAVASAPVLAVTDRAPGPSVKRTPEKSLIAVNAVVNGENTKILAGSQLDLIRGDVLTLTGAKVEGLPAGHRVSLNLIGFEAQSSERPWDDIGLTVDTARDLLAHHASDRERQIFTIRCLVGGVPCGDAYIRIFAPRLDYAEVAINGERRIVREGEVLVVSPTDQFRVVRFESNIKDPSRVRWALREVHGKTARLGEAMLSHRYEFVFSHAGQPFARLPVRVEAARQEAK